ncbi:MAG: STT3 domain-containing protein [Elusimicrobiota bacterium]
MKKLLQKLSRTCFGSKWFAIIIVVAVYFAISFYKVYLTKNLPQYDSKDDTDFYWTEEAFQYRYAKMVANGEKISEIDYKAQYPEGVYVYKDLTIFMEKIHGIIYRIFLKNTGMSFSQFLIYFVSFFSSISIIAVFFITKELWNNHLAGLMSSAFYSISLATITRTIGAYEYENFALPFIFFSLYFFLKSINSKSNFYLIGSAVCLSVALISWHFTRFYFLLFTIIVTALFFLYYPNIVSLVKSFVFIVIFCIITGIINPVLQTTSFLLSPAMLISYGLIVTYIFRHYIYFNRKLMFLFFAFVVITAVIVSNIFLEQKGYSHVYDLFIYKTLNFLKKPELPSQLPYSARFLWIEAFNSTALLRIIYFFLIVLLFALPGLFKSVKDIIKQKLTLDKTMFLFLAISWGLLYLYVERLVVFFI